ESMKPRVTAQSAAAREDSSVAKRIGSTLPAPVADFLQSAPARMFEQADPVAGVFELVDVGPDLGLPADLMRRRLAAGGAAGVQRDLNGLIRHGKRARQLDEDAAHFLNFFVFAQHVLVTQQIAEAQLLGLALCFGASMKRAILRAQLLGRVTRHPKRLFVGHLL